MDKLTLTPESRSSLVKTITTVALSMGFVFFAKFMQVDVANSQFALPLTVVGLAYLREVIGK